MGVPAEMIKLATQRMARINEAYSVLQKNMSV
jgi:DnaJ-domain-containing protein 1